MRKLTLEEAHQSVGQYSAAYTDAMRFDDFRHEAVATAAGITEVPGDLLEQPIPLSAEAGLSMQHMGTFVLWEVADLRYVVNKVAA